MSDTPTPTADDWNPPLDDEEAALLYAIRAIHEDAARSAKPYVDRLVALRSRRPPSILITKAQAEAFGIKLP